MASHQGAIEQIGHLRRTEDATVLLFASGRSAAHGVAAPLASFAATPQQLANAAFLIDLNNVDALVVPAADAHLVPRGAGGAELQARAGAMAQALRREKDRQRRRLRMPDHLLAYADALVRARSEVAVYRALRDVATPVVGAYTTAIFTAGGEQGPEPSFEPLTDPALRLELPPLPSEVATHFIEPCMVTAAEIEQLPEGPLGRLAPVLDAAGATQLFCAPVGADALLVLIERRRARVLAGEDRDLLSALVRQAEGALRRIAIERQLAALTLQVPHGTLAGSGRVHLLVEHALALAARGHALTAMLLDVTGTGTAEPMADLLGEELRRTDILLFPDERRCVVLLGDTDAAGAEVVLRRIRDRLGGADSLVAGVATYGPGRDTLAKLATVAMQNRGRTMATP